ncbi:MAG: hypothetical protein ACE14V_14955 [bacterium]
MTKLELVGTIDSLLPSKLTGQERQHLSFYPGKAVLESLVSALQASKSTGGNRSVAYGTLRGKAQSIVNKIRSYLGSYSEEKATTELANTTHGVLDKLLEGL